MTITKDDLLTNTDWIAEATIDEIMDNYKVIRSRAVLCKTEARRMIGNTRTYPFKKYKREWIIENLEMLLTTKPKDLVVPLEAKSIGEVYQLLREARLINSLSEFYLYKV